MPFLYKTSKTVKDENIRFAKMMQSNKKKTEDTVIHTVNGISKIDMAQVFEEILEKCPQITHIDPTQSVERNGQWKVFSRAKDNDVVRDWLATDLEKVVEGIRSRQIFA